MEPIETLNKRLLQNYGLFNTTNQALWRIVWSEDQMEKRWTTHNDLGWELLQPEVVERPKYRQWIKNKYILERLTAYPEFVERDVINRISYEPVWVFEDNKGNPLPPVWPAIYLIIEQVHKQAMNYVPGAAKYKDPDIVDPKDVKEKQLEDVKKLEEQLFGNETDVTDALAYKEGVTVPTTYVLRRDDAGTNDD